MLLVVILGCSIITCKQYYRTNKTTEITYSAHLTPTGQNKLNQIKQAIIKEYPYTIVVPDKQGSGLKTYYLLKAPLKNANPAQLQEFDFDDDNINSNQAVGKPKVVTAPNIQNSKTVPTAKAWDDMFSDVMLYDGVHINLEPAGTGNITRYIKGLGWRYASFNSKKRERQLQKMSDYKFQENVNGFNPDYN